jgi:hypothetical protein
MALADGLSGARPGRGASTDLGHAGRPAVVADQRDEGVEGMRIESEGLWLHRGWCPPG